MELANTASPCFGADDLEEGRIILFIDGLDEVTPESRTSIISRVLLFNKAYPRCKAIVASRNYSSVMSMPELASFARFQLTPIDLVQAQKMLDRLERSKGLAPQRSAELLRQLWTAPDLLDTFLSGICLVPRTQPG